MRFTNMMYAMKARWFRRHIAMLWKWSTPRRKTKEVGLVTQGEL